MSEYIERLMRCGYSADRAISTYRDFLKNFTIADLDIYVRQVEKDNYVDLLQSEPNWPQCR